jgi:FkbM family methyltransferase
MYSQSGEDRIIMDYYKKQGIETGIVLDIGANDGKTLSNSKLFIDNGWSAYLIEPSSSYGKIINLYAENDKVHFYNFGIGTSNSIVEFYESGSIFNGDDLNLVSSAIPTDRWKKATSFLKKEVPFLTFETFLKAHFGSEIPTFDFISIDAEGFDWDILSQIDLELHKTSCVCVEWNSLEDLDLSFTKYCNNFGLYEEHRNDENIIFVR